MMGGDVDRGLDRAGLPVIASVAWLLCHTGRIHDATPGRDSQPRGQPEPGVPGAVAQNASSGWAAVRLETASPRVGR